MRLVLFFLLSNVLGVIVASCYTRMPPPLSQPRGVLARELLKFEPALRTRSSLNEAAIQLRVVDRDHQLSSVFLQKLDAPPKDARLLVQELHNEILRLIQSEGEQGQVASLHLEHLSWSMMALAAVNMLGFGISLHRIWHKHRNALELETQLERSQAELRTTRSLATRQTEEVVLLRREHRNLREKLIAAVQEAELDPKGTGALTAKAGMRLLCQSLELNLGRVPVWVLIADADKFKNVNDTYGHRAGDIVLATLVGCLQTELREADFVFRYGGEEFVVVLVGGAPTEAYAIAERLRIKVAETPIWIGDRNLHVTFSGGLADCASTPTYTQVLKDLQSQSNYWSESSSQNQSETEALANEMIELADQHLYRAKQSGRNRICCSVSLETQTVATA